MNQAVATIYPCLLYRDAPAAMAWLAEAFGFEEMMRVPNDDGSIVHAEMHLGGGIIMVATARPHEGWLSPLDLPGVNQTVSVSVADVDAHHDRAVAAGAEITFPLKSEDYGRGYSCKDLEGQTWSFTDYQPTVG